MVEAEVTMPPLFSIDLVCGTFLLILKFDEKINKTTSKMANGKWLKGSGSALLCLRPLVLITGKYNWGDGN